MRDWVERFNAEGPDGLMARKQPGTPRRLNDAHRAALAKAVDEGPTPWRDGVVRWRLIDLVAWMYETFGVSSREDILGRELRGKGNYQEFRAWGSVLRPEVIPHVREVREETFTRDTC